MAGWGCIERNDDNNHKGMPIMHPAPVVLFTYNRLWHVQQTVQTLQKNEFAQSSELYLFSDGPRTENDKVKVAEVRKYLRAIDGFKKINIIERETNLGLAQSIIFGVTEIVNRYGRIIVLEDDMFTSPYFLRFMNDALNIYCNEDRVISIHGYVYPVREKLPETFFLRGADCWGWATWKRGWDIFESDGGKLLDELKTGDLMRRFDYDGAYEFSGMLEDYVNGKNNSWAIRWNASAFLRDKLTLYPGKSLVINIGVDGSGTHCSARDVFSAELSKEPILAEKIAIEENMHVREAFKKYFNLSKPSRFEAALEKASRILDKLT